MTDSDRLYTSFTNFCKAFFHRSMGLFAIAIVSRFKKTEFRNIFPIKIKQITSNNPDCKYVVK